MPPIVRIVLAFLCALAGYYFVYWVPLSVMQVEIGMLRTGLSAGAGIAVGAATWRLLGRAPASLAARVASTALAVGGVGFLAGFLGPILFMPDSPQGPMLGLVVTGPGGVLLGALAGLGIWYFRDRPRS